MRIIPESKMADSEEEDFVALGTPFEQLEEDVPRKKPVPIHEQIVTDDRGRRRFHGAFTGGFSAGYFNTVDTKEGWAPKSFVSSRSQKATEQTTQRPEDFMDEEDLSEFGIAPKRVVTTQKFLPTNSDGRKQTVNVASDSGTGLLGERLLQDLIVPVKMSVGVKLLSQMGWKEGQGVGPKVRRAVKKTYGCAGPPGTDMVQAEDEEDIYAVGLFFAPKDVEALNFTSKDNLHGIGYSGIDPKTALLSQRDWLGMDPSSSSIGIRGQGFGVGALEEDDEDIYSQDHLSNYDIELSTPTFKRKNDLHGWTGPQQSSGQGGLLSIFCKASKPPPARKHYPPPVVPKDFKPIHKIEETAEDKQPLSNHPGKQVQEVEKETQSAKRLTAKERGEALGETPLPTPKKSVFDYITEEDKSRLKESKEKAKVTKEHNKLLGNDDLQRRFTSSGPLSNSGFKPFSKDPGKQARYERYISGKSHADSSQTDSKMTEWERECELEEFARAAVLYRPLNQTMAARFTTAKESEESVENKDSGTSDQSNAAKMKRFGALTRERFEWHPDKILCKRFNIPNPYPGSGFTGVVRNRQEKIKTDKPVKREVKAIEYKPHSSSDNETKSSSHQDDTELTPKPSALVAGFQSFVSQRKHLPSQDTSAGSSSEAADKEEPNTDKQNSESDENVVKRASMDLFNEIFAESSSESDSESEENEEIEQPKNVEGDVKDNTERNDEGVDKSSVLPSSDPPIPIPESNTPADEVVEREPSPEAFGPALPSSFTGNTSSQRPSKAEFQFSTREDSPRRRDKQKRRKKKKRKNKDSDSDITDSDDGYSRRRKDKKKKRSKKKENDWTDSDEHQSKKSRKKTRVEDTDSDLTDSESEGFTRHKKKKSKYSKDKYTKHKKNKKRETLYDSDDSSNDEHTKHKKYKRNKEKTEKERKNYTDKNSKNKQSDSPEYKEYKPEEYVEKVSRSFTNEKSSRTFISEQGQSSSSGLKREKHSGNSRKDTSEGVRNPGVERTGNDPEESQVARVPDSKEIINKLKNIQMLKERKRMRAADFM